MGRAVGRGDRGGAGNTGVSRRAEERGNRSGKRVGRIRRFSTSFHRTGGAQGRWVPERASVDPGHDVSDGDRTKDEPDRLHRGAAPVDPASMPVKPPARPRRAAPDASGTVLRRRRRLHILGPSPSKRKDTAVADECPDGPPDDTNRSRRRCARHPEPIGTEDLE